MLLCPPVCETKHTKCETKHAECFYTFSLELAVSMQLFVLTNHCGHRTLRLSWITFSAPFLSSSSSSSKFSASQFLLSFLPFLKAFFSLPSKNSV